MLCSSSRDASNLLKADWDIELRYNKDTSFTLSVKLYYAYPVVSEEIEDDVVITQ